MEVLCDHEHCAHQKGGECTANGVSFTSYCDLPFGDDMECNTFETKEVN